MEDCARSFSAPTHAPRQPQAARKNQQERGETAGPAGDRAGCKQRWETHRDAHRVKRTEREAKPREDRTPQPTNFR